MFKGFGVNMLLYKISLEVRSMLIWVVVFLKGGDIVCCEWLVELVYVVVVIIYDKDWFW